MASTATAWLFSTRQYLKAVLAIAGRIEAKFNQLERTMSDLTAAVADNTAATKELKDEVAAIGSEMDTLFTDLTNALGSSGAAAVPEVQAATAAIRAQIDALKAAGARDLPAAPAP